MDKQYYIDNHIGLFKNFMPDELINNYLTFFNNCEKQGGGIWTIFQKNSRKL